MRSKNKTEARIDNLHVIRRVCGKVATVYPYLLAFYVLSFVFSKLSKSWSVLVDLWALGIVMAALTIAAVFGWSCRQSDERHHVYAKHLLSLVLVVSAFAIKSDIYSFAILIFGISVVVYRRLEVKYALIAGTLSLTSVPLLEALGYEYASLSLAVFAFYFLVVVLFSSIRDLIWAPIGSGYRDLPT